MLDCASFQRQKVLELSIAYGPRSYMCRTLHLMPVPPISSTEHLCTDIENFEDSVFEFSTKVISNPYTVLSSFVYHTILYTHIPCRGCNELWTSMITINYWTTSYWRFSFSIAQAGYKSDRTDLSLSWCGRHPSDEISFTVFPLGPNSEPRQVCLALEAFLFA